MSEQISIEKQVFDKNIFPKVIDTQFSQLLNNISEELSTLTIDDFFELYDQLFYQIPREGEINSHRYILEREAEYLGVNINQDDIQALLDEITLLRQQSLDNQNLINQVTKALPTSISGISVDAKNNITDTIADITSNLDGVNLEATDNLPSAEE